MQEHEARKPPVSGTVLESRAGKLPDIPRPLRPKPSQSTSLTYCLGAELPAARSGKDSLGF